jgi:S-adenosyl-L-methionine hydrolase (adenosine-forming)
MPAPLITLTTDFGTASPYVAAMKGVVLQTNPDVRLIDLSHSLPPQDLRSCSFFLRNSVPYFPDGTLHVVVVDPGVGTDRAILCVDLDKQRLLVPDNGCWTELARAMAVKPEVVKLTETRFCRPFISSTFHGRDAFAPVAGHLSLGVRPHELGPPVESWVDFTLPVPRISAKLFEGEVIFVDDFGNLITNLPGESFLKAFDRILKIQVGEHAVTRTVRTYGEASLGEMVALVSSAGTVEVAEVQGNASHRLGAQAGTPVYIQLYAADERG